jgi:ParB family chromosome partitioning protein
MKKLAQRAIREGLSVRALEALIRGLAKKPAKKGGPAESASTRDLAARLQRHLGARSRIVQTSASSGRLEVQYTSLDELDGILTKIGLR